MLYACIEKLGNFLETKQGSLLFSPRAVADVRSERDPHSLSPLELEVPTPKFELDSRIDLFTLASQLLALARFLGREPGDERGGPLAAHCLAPPLINPPAAPPSATASLLATRTRPHVHASSLVFFSSPHSSDHGRCACAAARVYSCLLPTSS